MLYTPYDSSFISIQFLVLNLDGWFSALPNKFLFDISLLYYFINIRSSILFCLSSGDIYLYDVYLQLFLNYFVMNFLRRWQFYQQFYFQSDQLLLLFFDIPLLYYYINLSSSIISCISSGDIHLSLTTSLSCLFLIVSELLCGKVFKFSSCNSSSNFITNQDTSCFCCFFSLLVLFSVINNFLAVFTFEVFTEKSTAFYKYSISRLNWISCNFLYFTI